MAQFYSMLSRNRSSDRSAFTDESDHSLSYTALFTYADRLGSYLNTILGEGNYAVGVFQYKTLTAVAGIFGVLAAGKAFVPIDPKLPKSRIDHILEAAAIRLVVVDSSISSDDLSYFSGKDIVVVTCCVDDAGFDFQSPNAGDIATRGASPRLISEERLSHVLFTSGTTGSPKGVMIKEESQIAFTKTMADAFGHDQDTRWLSLSPLYFDVCTLDLFVEVYCGSTVFLMTPGVMAHQVANALDKYRITHVLLISSIVKMLASEFSGLEKRDLSNIQELWYGGEACPVEALRKISSLLPHVRFAQCYGPSEVCNNSTLYKFDSVPDDIGGFMPLGQTIATVEGYILDEMGNLLTGEGIGELYLGGVQVMAGYVNDEVETSKCLLKNTFNPSSPYKIYKTGDYVRVDKNGLMYFHGRKDDLIKIRGNRVSLHEVQSAIVSIPKVLDAIVYVRKDDIGGMLDSLNAIVVCNTAMTAGELKLALKPLLATYMIPDKFQIETSATVPIKENGKIDRAQLLNNFPEVQANAMQ